MKRLMVATCALVLAGSARAVTTNIYILAGQSNMAGRGILTPENRIDMSRILNWDEKGKHWVEAVEPLFHDRPNAGASPGAQFARAMADRDPDVVIGLIPAAVGGTSLQNWTGFLANNAIAMTKEALKGGGELKGVIWHQGCSDCSPKQARTYCERLMGVVYKFRKAFDNPKLPFVVGELGAYLEDFKVNGKAAGGEWREVNRQLALLVDDLPYTRLVSSEGVKPNPDILHFDTPSARLMGARYAEAMQELLKPGAAEKDPRVRKPLTGPLAFDDELRLCGTGTATAVEKLFRVRDLAERKLRWLDCHFEPQGVVLNPVFKDAQLNAALPLLTELNARITTPVEKKAEGRKTDPRTAAPRYDRWWVEWLGQSVRAIKETSEPDIALVGDNFAVNMTTRNMLKTWEASFGGRKTVTVGYGSETTRQLLWRMENGMFDIFKAKVIVLHVGTSNRERPEEVSEGIRLVVEGLRKHQPQAKIVLLAIQPFGEKPDNPLRVNADKVNGLVRAWAKDMPNVRTADFSSLLTDGTGAVKGDLMRQFQYPNEVGYARVIPRLREIVDGL